MQQVAQSTAAAAAELLYSAFTRYHDEFQRITARAQHRFEERDWHGLHGDAQQRLDLYGECVRDAVTALRELLGDAGGDRALLAAIKDGFRERIAKRPDFDIAQSFYNSVLIREARAAGIVGISSDIEFLGDEVVTPPAGDSVFVTLRNNGNASELIRNLLEACRFSCKWRDAAGDASMAASKIESLLSQMEWGIQIGMLDVSRSLFYRGKRAYLVGRAKALKGGVAAGYVPLVLALANGPEGLYLDAVLMDEDEVSILFSFAREYFHVESDRPQALVQFLRTIMPRKPVAELYISIGHNKHGKTERYRDLMRHMNNSSDRFRMAEGDRGMVMQVFTLPSYDLVFKIIKDSFDYPKRTTRQEVHDRYALVFRHDRGGRLVDAQEFEHLRFEKSRFEPDMLHELLTTASRTVRVEGETVVFEHLYTERRLTPLNLYLRAVSDEAARPMVVEYGYAIKDLASTNIFPGDILLKNFGVTRHGRIVFYDYDELCLLTDCNFRTMPQSADDDDDDFDAFAPEPWFSVAENDVFPEELHTFLGLPLHLKPLFYEHHGDLFTADYWNDLKRRLQAGEVIEVLPYGEGSKLA